jgi:hypothetical protein
MERPKRHLHTNDGVLSQDWNSVCNTRRNGLHVYVKITFGYEETAIRIICWDNVEQGSFMPVGLLYNN